MGLLVGQRTRPTGFADPTPSELDRFYKTDTREKGRTLDYEQDDLSDIATEEALGGPEPYIRPQNK